MFPVASSCTTMPEMAIIARRPLLSSFVCLRRAHTQAAAVITTTLLACRAHRKDRREGAAHISLYSSADSGRKPSGSKPKLPLSKSERMDHISPPPNGLQRREIRSRSASAQARGGACWEDRAPWQCARGWRRVRVEGEDRENLDDRNWLRTPYVPRTSRAMRTTHAALIG